MQTSERACPVGQARDPLSLHGKVALISGGASGIGAAIASLFQAQGACVTVADIVVTEMQASDACLQVGLDVREPGSWAKAVELTLAQFGRLDILVNCAGVFSVAPIEKETVNRYMRMVEINQLGTFLGMQAVFKPLQDAGSGSIINLSSAAGLTGTPLTVAYTATKWAVRGMTKVAALEFAPFNIRVNSIHPSAVATPMLGGVPGMGANAGQSTPMKRVAFPEEIAEMALFLASDSSRYSTGSEFVCDGGLTAGRSPI